MPSKPDSDTSSQIQTSMFSQDAFAPRKSTPTFGDNQTPEPLFSSVATAPFVEQNVHESQPESTNTATTPPGSPKVAPAKTNLFNRGQEAQAESRPVSIEPTNQVLEGTAVAITTEPAHPASSETDEWQPPGKINLLLFHFPQSIGVFLLT